MISAEDGFYVVTRAGKDEYQEIGKMKKQLTFSFNIKSTASSNYVGDQTLFDVADDNPEIL